MVSVPTLLGLTYEASLAFSRITLNILGIGLFCLPHVHPKVVQGNEDVAAILCFLTNYLRNKQLTQLPSLSCLSVVGNYAFLATCECILGLDKCV